MYPRLFADLFEHVYTFEPDAQNFYCLAQNCARHNIHKFECALGKEAGMVDLNRPHNANTGMHEVVFKEEGRIPILPLDAFTFPFVDLIQLDVEGHESAIIAGALKTIEKHRPVITCERGNSDIMDMLKAFDYEATGNSVSDTIYRPI